jgi:hypothetical protein
MYEKHVQLWRGSFAVGHVAALAVRPVDGLQQVFLAE